MFFLTNVYLPLLLLWPKFKENLMHDLVKILWINARELSQFNSYLRRGKALLLSSFFLPSSAPSLLSFCHPFFLLFLSWQKREFTISGIFPFLFNLFSLETKVIFFSFIYSFNQRLLSTYHVLPSVLAMGILEWTIQSPWPNGDCMN